MPRRSVKLSAAEKALAAEMRALDKKNKAEARARARGTTLKVDKNENLRGPGARLLRSVVGGRAFDTAVERFGGNIVRRAAAAMERERKATIDERARAVEKTKAALRARGLTPDEIARHRARSFPRVRVPDVRFIPLRRGPYKFKREIRKNGKFRDDGTRYKTATGARRARVAHERIKSRAKIAEALEISLTRAKSVVRDVERRALKDLAAFKKTAAYKNRSARWKRGITAKRWRAASVAALYELMEIDYSS